MSDAIDKLRSQAAADLCKSQELYQSVMDDIERSQQRLSTLRENLKDRPAMKYALESLPELIGTHQFNILIDALGLTDEYLFVKSDGGRDAGEFFAAAVTQKANGNRRKMSENERALDRKLTGAPEGLDV